MYTNYDWFRDELLLDKPDFNIEAYLLGRTEISLEIKGALKNFYQNGFAIFKNAISEDLIDDLEKDIVYLRKYYKDFDLKAEYRGIQMELDEMSNDQVNSAGMKFNSIHTISNAAKKISLNPILVNFLKIIFESPPCVLQSLTFFKGSQQRAHLDYPYVRTQKRIPVVAASWVALEDIHPNAGALEYYPGSHKICRERLFDWGGGSILYESDSEKTPSQFSSYLEELMDSVGLSKQIYCPKKGDLLVWHSLLVHGGGSIVDNELTRKSYVTHYTSRESYPDGFGAEKSKENLEGSIINGGYCFEYPWLDINRRILPSV
jgi:ectoine hydroxylase-related dioxygenase (phytanoyl-CoA dioxygenase family)